MAASSSVRTFPVHTPRGRRFFHLVEGSIADTAADLIVASTHAFPDRNLTGQVLEALRARFGIADGGFRPLALTSQGSACGTHWQEHQGRLFLLVRMHSAGETPLDVYTEAVQTLFGSVATLELRHRRPRSMSLPVIAARQDYPFQDAVRILLDSVLNWLTMSQSMDEVSLYIPAGQGMPNWDHEIDALLGRTYFASAEEGMVEHWAVEVASLLQRVQARPAYEQMSLDWVRGLKDAIKEKGIAWWPLAQSARRMAEWIARQLLACCEVPAEPGATLHKMLGRLESTHRVAPLHLGYLGHLRVAGNQASHSGQADLDYTPDEKLHLLLTLAGALWCWLCWPSPGESLPSTVADDAP